MIVGKYKGLFIYIDVYMEFYCTLDSSKRFGRKKDVRRFIDQFIP